MLSIAALAAPSLVIQPAVSMSQSRAAVRVADAQMGMPQWAQSAAAAALGACLGALCAGLLGAICGGACLSQQLPAALFVGW